MAVQGNGDNDEKLAWLRKATDKGYVHAYHALGQRYEDGSGVEQSDDLAWEWYKRAADAGYAESQFKCARYYLSNKRESFLTDDGPEWFRLLELAAEQGHPVAQSVLECYTEEEVDVDATDQFQWRSLD